MQTGGKYGRIIGSDRASNVRDLGPLGDPERWGGHVDLDVFLPPALVAITVRAESAGFARIQALDLVARGFDLLAAWSVEPILPPGSIVLPALRFVLGAGQNSGVATLDLAASAAFSFGAPGWRANVVGGTFYSGVATTIAPLPIVAASVQAQIEVTAAVAVGTTVRLSVDLFMAPRGLQ